VSQSFAELSHHVTPLGDLVLRRRNVPGEFREEIYEIKLGDDFLMSSQFNEAEQALATHALAALNHHTPDVLVGGLGLGYTACAALAHAAVKSLTVVEVFPEVVQWHRDAMVPLGADLCADERCRFVVGDFFEMARGTGFDPLQPHRQFDAVLLDIDHSPRNTLADANLTFYTRKGLTEIARFVKKPGVFAMWSNDPPDTAFEADLRSTFDAVTCPAVKFRNTVSMAQYEATIYVAQFLPDPPS